MKRLQGKWIRHGVHLGLLAGLGLAFVGGGSEPAKAGAGCPNEGQCTFKKPNFMIIMDYSSSMNTEFDAVNMVSRWEAAANAVKDLMIADNSYFSENMHIALMRFGHDPNPDATGTTIPNDTSGIVDGQSLDVNWYDPAAQDKSYFGCNGQAIIDSLNATPEPLCQGPQCNGIGTWTNGALLRSQSSIAQSRADHPTDTDAGEERFYANLLLTDGLWTDVVGFPQLTPPGQDPEITAGALYNGGPLNDPLSVPTYVVAMGDANGQAEVDQIAAAGGTGAAIDATNQQNLIDALKQVVDDIKNSIIIPECTGGLPRIMIILDASSSMLNVNGVAGSFGLTGWDEARDALAGTMSIFDVEVGTVMQPVEDLVHLGLAVFGGQGEQTVLVDYGPCMKDNFKWALDPNTSCGVGCADPWGGPPITWTFQDSPPALGYDGTPFDQPTSSHMPQCGVGGNPNQCTGSGTYTHLGLALAASNQMAYATNPPPLYPVSPTTVFANILITDGNYTSYSTDQQVRDELVAMYNNNITTYVIGLGSGIGQAQLDNMACWGSGGNGVPVCAGGTVASFSAATQQDLEAALKTIIEGLNFDPCCAFNDCSMFPEPTTGEPDDEPTSGGPITTGPPPTTSGGTGGSTSGGTGGSASAGSTGTGGSASVGTSGTGGTGATATASGTGSTGSTGGATVTATDSGTGGSGTVSATDSAGSTSSASASDSNTDSASDSASDSNTDSDSATITASDSNTAGETDSDSSTAGALDDDGCGCSTDRSDGPLGWLFGLGLLGFRRRRR